MSANRQNSVIWFSLYRRLPRWHLPRLASFIDAISLGVVFGTALLLAIYLAQIFLIEWVQQVRPFTALDYWEWNAYAFAVPIVLCLGFWVGAVMRKRNPAPASGGSETTFDRLIFQLRERHTLKRWDALVLLVLLIFGWLARRGSISPTALEIPLILAITVQSTLGLMLKRNRFHPNARRFVIPRWLLDLINRERFHRRHPHEQQQA